MAYEEFADIYGPVKTTGGLIRGYQYEGVYNFRNIKYAEAPRFYSPVPAHWEGVRDCMSYGFVPPLLEQGNIGDHFYVPHFYWVENEKECLNLNVFTPSMDRKDKLPVVFCVYGASFDTGSSCEMMAYDGTNLVKKGNIVYVTINMRANMLGFFNLACFGDEYRNTGNLGFEDVHCALQWVKDNIETFGGDPDNITLLGMQGGALRIRYIMQCPSFKGMFSKAFLLSGVADHGRPPEGEKFFRLARGMLREGGFDENDVTTLVTMPLEDLHRLYRQTVTNHPELKARWRLQLNGYCYGRVEDEGVCPQMKDITVVCGNTFTEQYSTPDRYPNGRISEEEFETMARERFGEDYDEIMEQFRQHYPDSDYRDVMFYAIDHRKAITDYCGVLADSGMDVYVYQFMPTFPFNNGTPSFHCSDVGYITRNLHLMPELIIPGVSERLVDEYSGALIDLARYGTPAHGELKDWAKYTRNERNTMLFKENSEMMKTDDLRLVHLLAKHMPAKRSNNQEKR